MVAYLIAALNRQEGQDLAEYSLIIVLVAIVVVAALGTLGTALNTFFTHSSGLI